MKNSIIKLLFLVVLFFGTVNFFTPQAKAQLTETTISITPFLQELEVAKGDEIESSIDVTNLTDTKVNLRMRTQDFLPGKRGEPQFVPDTEFNDVTFSLSSWLTIADGSQVFLEPKQTKTIRFTVSPPANAEQGTHYGAILFSTAEGQSLDGVSITQSVGTIILVNYGEARSQGQNSLTTNKLIEWWNDKFEFSNLFVNTGNVHVKPKGEITIKNIFGKQVASLTVNRDAANVLPQSDRTFIVDWFPGNFSFGPYRAELLLTYGRERLEIRDKLTIWVFSGYILVLIIAILIFVGWYIVHGRHWHKRKILQRHEQSLK